MWRFLKPRVAVWARHRNNVYVSAELTFALPSTDQLHQLLGRKVLAEAKVRQLSRLQETERQLAEAIVAALNGQERVLREFEDSIALYRRLQVSLRNESGVSVEELEERLADVNQALVVTGDMRQMYAEPSDQFEETLQRHNLEAQLVIARQLRRRTMEVIDKSAEVLEELIDELEALLREASGDDEDDEVVPWATAKKTLAS